MMTFCIVLAAAAQAYLLGSIDTGILVSKYLYHDDVRNHGSGAAGMTNMLRTFGKKAAALTAAGDVLQRRGRRLHRPLALRGFPARRCSRFALSGCVSDRHLWPWSATPSPSISASRAARACWWRAVPSLAIQPILLPRCCRRSSCSAVCPPAWCRWAASSWPLPIPV